MVTPVAVKRYQQSPKGRAIAAAWRAANKDRARAANLRHRAKHGNPPQDPEYQRRYRAANKEQIAASKARYAASPAGKGREAARGRKRQDDPAYRAAQLERSRTPEGRAYAAHYSASPAGRARAAAHRAKPESKAKAAARHRERLADPEYVARRRTNSARFLASENGRLKRVVYSRRRTALKANAPGDGVTVDQWAAILEAHPYCEYCSKRDVKLVMEHMTPLSRGGAHDVTNVTPACGPCNTRKMTRTAAEYREEILCP